MHSAPPPAPTSPSAPCRACSGTGVAAQRELVPASWYGPAEVAVDECRACGGSGEVDDPALADTLPAPAMEAAS